MVVPEWWNAGIVEWNGCWGGSWVEWWVVGLLSPREKITRKHLELDGMAVWRLHQIILVRTVFVGLCDTSKLELRGGTPESP